MDEADRATDETEKFTATAIDNLRRKQKLAQAQPTADECVECGELIPSARQVALPGCQHCVYCASKLELPNRRR